MKTVTQQTQDYTVYKTVTQQTQYYTVYKTVTQQTQYYTVYKTDQIKLEKNINALFSSSTEYRQKRVFFAQNATLVFVWTNLCV
jgi:hypothetical protein